MAAHRVNEGERRRMYEALAFGMLNLGLFIEGRAKQFVPVRTGNLRRSIHTVAFIDKKIIGRSGDELAPFGPADYSEEQDGIGVIVGTNAGYGIFVELGTVRMSARPFLTPAAQEGVSQAPALIREGAEKHYGAPTP
jgi:HK97 gp10 family phage protein